MLLLKAKTAQIYAIRNCALVCSKNIPTCLCSCNNFNFYGAEISQIYLKIYLNLSKDLFKAYLVSIITVFFFIVSKTVDRSNDVTVFLLEFCIGWEKTANRENFAWNWFPPNVRLKPAFST